MADILYDYRFGHRCFRYGSINEMWSTSLRIERDEESISDLIKKCNSVEEIIDIIEANSKILNFNFSRFPHFYFKVTIDNKHIVLSHILKILTDEDLEREEFEPYIKYDIDDIREGTLVSIECHLLECKDAQEQVELIDQYLRRPYRRFSKWATKPNKLFLYHTYGAIPKEFRISFD